MTPDPSKPAAPVSSTPRTDAAIIFPGSGIAMVHPDFAHSLEAENVKLRTAAREYIDAHHALNFESESQDPESFYRVAKDVREAERALEATLTIALAPASQPEQQP